MGCDHAYVDIRLLQEGKVTHALAMDVAGGPLATARSNLELTELLGDGRQGCELRKSDGLAQYIPGEAQVLICAGMGGILMRSILEKEPEKALSFQEMILSPHREVNLVREWLFANGCRIAQERFFQEEGKYYTVMRVLCPCSEKGEAPRAGQYPDWDRIAGQIRAFPKEVLQKAMVSRESLCRILEDAAFRKMAEESWGPCILEEYLSGRDPSASPCFDRFVKETLRSKLQLMKKLADSPSGENAAARMNQLSGEIGTLQVLLAVHELTGLQTGVHAG